MENKSFINAFSSWSDTHFEVVRFITEQLMKDEPMGIIGEVYEKQGTFGLWILAEDATEKFEVIHKNRVWDGEYFDEIISFLEKEFSK